jgi:hypothetical protein
VQNIFTIYVASIENITQFMQTTYKRMPHDIFEESYNVNPVISSKLPQGIGEL